MLHAFCQDGSFGIVLTDLDHIKYVNDAYGHVADDAVLRETTQQMMASVRRYDTVGRYGCEECLIVVPSSDAMGALGIIRTNPPRNGSTAPLPLIPFPSRSPQALASPPAPRRGRSTPRETLKLADDALYRAKEHGRNRSELATPQDVTTTSPVPAGTRAEKIAPH